MGSELPRAYGPYELLANLGEGAAGHAFLARPLESGRGLPTPLVIKRLRATLSGRTRFIKRFKHEAQVAVQIASPHVVRVFDVGQIDETFYMALEYVAGFPSNRWVHELRTRRIPMPVDIAVGLVTQGLRGLSDLHVAKDEFGEALEVVHRDVAPKNIMIGDDGRLCLIDLGIGKSKAQDWKTEQGRILGSPGYMSPEQMMGAEVSPAIDVYSMGVVLNEWLAGRRYIGIKKPVEMMREALEKPFEPPSKLRPDISKDLDDIVRKAMSLKPERRFANAQAFADALQACSDSASESRIAAFFAGHLGELQRTRQNKVEDLCAVPLPDVDELEPSEHTVVLACRPGIQPTQLRERPVSGLRNLVENVVSEPRPFDTELASDAYIHQAATPPPSLAFRILLGFAFIGVVAGVAGLWVMTTPQPDSSIEVVPAQPAVVAAPQPKTVVIPSATRSPEPTPQVTALPPSEPETPPVVDAVATSPQVIDKPERRRPDRAKAKRRRTAARPKPGPKPVSDEEYAARLGRRARALMGKLPSGPDRKAVVGIVNKISFVMRSPNSRDQLEGLSRDLAAIRRRAKPPQEVPPLTPEW